MISKLFPNSFFFFIVLFKSFSWKCVFWKPLAQMVTSWKACWVRLMIKEFSSKEEQHQLCNLFLFKISKEERIVEMRWFSNLNPGSHHKFINKVTKKRIEKDWKNFLVTLFRTSHHWPECFITMLVVLRKVSSSFKWLVFILIYLFLVAET